MSYQVLARKWRPRLFREMVGQEHVLQALINALDNNRLHHAYLFAGTRGVGKTTIARILAKCLNCETGVSSEPCGQCSACSEIADGRFVDLIEVDAASRTKVEDTRELLENVQYAPTRGRYKVYLIDEVHMLSNSSFNALLKTLEEPPPHVKFLLATTDPQKLPVTVLSRCLQFNLKNMSPERVVAHLRFVLEQELVPFEEAALWHLGRAADGSMRDAMSLTDQAIAFGGGKISEDEVRAMLGTLDSALVWKLVQALAAEDPAALFAAVNALSEQAPDYSAALAELASILHRIAIAQVLPQAIDNALGDAELLQRYAATIASENVQLYYQMALLARRDLPLAPDPRGGFEMALLRMLAFKPQGVANIPTARIGAPATPAVPEQAPAIPSGFVPDQNATVMGEDVGEKKPSRELDPAPAGPDYQPGDYSSAVGVAPAQHAREDVAALQAAPQPQSPEPQSPGPQSPEPQSLQPQQAPVDDTPPWEEPAVRADDVAPTPPSSPVEAFVEEAAPAREQAAPDHAAPMPVEQNGAVDDQSRVPAAEQALSGPGAENPVHEDMSAPVMHQHPEYQEAVGQAPEPDARAEMRERLRQQVAAVVSAPAPAAPSPAAQPVKPAAAEPARPAARLEALTPGSWPAMYPQLGVTGILHSIASHLELLGRQDNILSFTLDHAFSSLYDEGHQRRLADVLGDFFQQPLVVQIQVGEVVGGTPARLVAATKEAQLQSARDALSGDPLVQDLQAELGAQLVPESVEFLG
ncbi:DNA polymerase III subunit gamma/tau [Microbulbifer sp. SA54]|uniref:DNA polymerase III subunit gamma/tau n=1 Tax=Microbulbifer sp. SA54 TaxID=3401577 RepID=UPI003AAE88E9